MTTAPLLSSKLHANLSFVQLQPGSIQTMVFCEIVPAQPSEHSKNPQQIWIGPIVYSVNTEITTDSRSHSENYSSFCCFGYCCYISISIYILQQLSQLSQKQHEINAVISLILMCKLSHRKVKKFTSKTAHCYLGLTAAVFWQNNKMGTYLETVHTYCSQEDI